MKYLKYLSIFSTLLTTQIEAESICKMPADIRTFIQKKSLNTLSKYSDVKRNFKTLKKLCVDQIAFTEGKYHWKMLLVSHPKKIPGIFWFLPHDDEDTAFDAAVYATQKYGGGFLAVISNNKRYFLDQDPNRNFGETDFTAKTCKKQKYPAPKYSQIVFRVIDAFKDKDTPYLALHNNKDGWYGNGGEGGVSILKSSRIVQSYLAHKSIEGKENGLKDEDSLIYIAGFEKKPDKDKLDRLLKLGIHTKYEIISKNSNDCSLSNYVVLKKGTTDYYNLEVEHKDLKTHKLMIDKVVKTFD